MNGATLFSPEIKVHGPHCSACMQTAPGLGQVECTQVSLVLASDSTFQRKLFVDLKTCKQYAMFFPWNVHGEQP